VRADLMIRLEKELQSLGIKVRLVASTRKRVA
jgi:hypothetical protein